MAIYQSMQRVRFSSTDDYEKFKIVFGDVRHHLKSLPGFLHLTWWTHPQDPTWITRSVSGPATRPLTTGT